MSKDSCGGPLRQVRPGARSSPRTSASSARSTVPGTVLRALEALVPGLAGRTDSFAHADACEQPAELRSSRASPRRAAFEFAAHALARESTRNANHRTDDRLPVASVRVSQGRHSNTQVSATSPRFQANGSGPKVCPQAPAPDRGPMTTMGERRGTRRTSSVETCCSPTNTLEFSIGTSRTS